MIDSGVWTPGVPRLCFAGRDPLLTCFSVPAKDVGHSLAGLTLFPTLRPQPQPAAPRPFSTTYLCSLFLPWRSLSLEATVAASLL
jgi:hypothetical protein